MNKPTDKPADPSAPRVSHTLDRASILIDAKRELAMPSRRLFGKQLLTLGGLSMLTGCSLTDDASVNHFLTAVSRLNDRAQAALFDPKQLAPTYTEAQITRPFPFNAYYGIDDVPHVDGSDYQLKLSGLVTGQRVWTLPELYALPHAEQITRHICVEGWSAIGRWGGTPFADFLRRVGADTTAKYVGFKCADDYYESIDMPTALHPQTLLTFSYDGERLPAKYGYPMKLRMPTKLGYKNPKHIVEIFVTNTFPGGYWVDQGYNWFGGS
ncbi:molybdopterin-binding protein [Paraburkholderia sp. UYCP14C]|uniref:molybdopterin-dependent oxidoreductase n=1 Tax=Paraburkholderia sp. UYCP14C TaxID=2511130 RepID=UPI0010201076|nr:molybdopterin-dependent oxidoreductase [Paraburkholderia sp. UYCP14C]RZF26568.1 molybdopterin-binding protein [Paraburkholderia sp. UYCP14C]